MIARNQRPVSSVPRSLIGALLVTLAVQIGWQSAQPRPVARAEALEQPPPLGALRVLSLGEPVPLAQMTTLYLQAFDNQPGISIPFRDLDYSRVIAWLSTILELDPVTQYPLLMAAHLYGQVPDPARERMMFEFVHREFMRDPNRRWRWLANVSLACKHRLKDLPLALQYAREIAQWAPAAPAWARQMHIILLEEMGEIESAKILIGGLLDSGQITDEFEMRFLLERLEELKKKAEISTPSSKN